METPFSLLGFEFISDIVFWVFIGCVGKLCFNQVPKFLSDFIVKFPRVSYYLASFGWIPYVLIVVTLLFIASMSFIEYPKEFILACFINIAFGALFMVVFSLFVAFVRARIGHKAQEEGKSVL